MIVNCVFTDAPADNDLIKIFYQYEDAVDWINKNKNDKYPAEGKWAQYQIQMWEVE